MAALTEDGKMYSWGLLAHGGGGCIDDQQHKVRDVYSTYSAFTLITEGGLVASWGDSDWGGAKPTSLKSAQAIFSTNRAFAALTEEGTVVAWGDLNYGGTAPLGLTNVRTIFSNTYAFAALKKDGTVVAWGNSKYGGSMADDLYYTGVPANLVNVKTIYPNRFAFAALKEDGTVQAWGYGQWGGAGVPANLTNVIAIYASANAFAALRKDGTVRAWGAGGAGGVGVPADLSHVTAIYSTFFAFCAHLSDGRVRVWGSPGEGGTQPSNLDAVSSISSTSKAFAALTEHETVVAWGNPQFGGGMTDVTIDGVLFTGVPAGMTNVRALYSTTNAFAALMEDGTVQAWGDSRYGGKVPSSSDVRGIRSIFSSAEVFAALKEDGTIFAWGDPTCGGSMTDGQDTTFGNYTGVPSGLKNVKTIFSDTTYYADSTAAQLLPCPHNTYGPGFPDCTACPQGSKQPVGRPGIRSKVWSCIDCDIERNGTEKFSVDGKTCNMSCAHGYQVIPYNWYGSATRLEGDMCFTCLPGSYFADGDCKLCPLGRYQDTKGQHSCKECTAGKYTRSGEGSTKCSSCPRSKTVLRGRGYAASDCFKICPKGQYGSTESDKCLPCKAGTYNNLTSGTNVCTPCEAGKAQPLTNQSSCSLCAAGKWANIHVATKCFECPPGSSCSRMGMNDPEPCPVGRYADTKMQLNCSACPAGRYQNSTGSAKCLFCDAGKYNHVHGSNSTSACKECSAGRFSSRGGADACQACGRDTYSNSTMQSRTACVPCERGKSTEGEGPNGDGLAATKCVEVESACDPGQTRRGGLCYGCPPGNFSANGLQCLACSPGTYSEAWNSSICIKCPAGRYGEVKAGSSLKSACMPCAKGRYVSTLGSLTCIECPPGSSCSRMGMNDSEPCPVGRYTDVKMQFNCSPCPTGRYHNSTGSAKCLFCDAGKYNPVRGSNSTSACKECSLGRFSSREGATACQACGRDTYSNSTMQSRTACVPCERGKSTEGEGPNGDGLAATKCVEVESACDPGQTRRGGLCYGCPPGNFSANGLQCLACSPGTYSEAWNSSICIKCPAGRYGEVKAGSSLKSACMPCAKGRYVSTLGSLTCIKCPPGSSCSRKGMNDSEPCPVGRYTDVKLQVNCSACPAGRYQNSTGSAKCLFCPKRTFLDSAGANSRALCKQCPPGTYGDKEGLSECSKCPTGQVQPNEGKVSCKDCSLEGKIKTNNAEHTACVDNDELLQSFSIVNVIYSNGTVWVGSLTIATLFVAAAAILTYFREKMPTLLANFSRVEALYYSFLPGFSFGSWVFLVVTVANEDTALAVVMSLSRLLHFSGGILIVLMLFGDENLGARMSQMSHYMERVFKQRNHVDSAFVRENVYIVEMVSLLSLCDVTMFRFIPWSKSEFFKLSEGFPSMTIMNLCLTIKTVETTISVICDIAYLSLYGDSKSSPSEQEQQTQALFVLNIIFGVSTIVMDLLVLFVRRGVLTEVKDETSSAVGTTSEGRNGRGPKRNSGGLEMGDLFPRNHDNDSDVVGDIIPPTTNPMQIAALEQLEQREKELEASKAIIELQSKYIKQLKQQHQELQDQEQLQSVEKL
jgi:alpha-tubulin suppressor-like RCC1 family protein